MLIVGELINTSRKAIKEAVEKQDKAYIQQIAQEEAAAGADVHPQDGRVPRLPDDLQCLHEVWPQPRW